MNINSVETFIINPFDEMSLVEEAHKKLEKEAQPSFFNSWIWISNWLEMMPRSDDLNFVTHFLEDELIGCYFIGLKTLTKFNILKKEKAYLNATGYLKYDDLVIEYNNILITKAFIGRELELIQLAVDVNDIVLPVSTIDVAKNNDYFYQECVHPSYWVNLDLIREEKKPYLSYLSKNKRNQINRSVKAYGDVRLEFAQTTHYALSMFDSLVKLHQKDWESRGESGAFSNQFLYDFHRQLISDNFEKGNIQLIIVYNNKETIGFLYNFIYNNEVLFYQCGFEHKQGNNFRPGLVTHFKAIEHNLANGLSKYNFLAGTDQYKKSLSTNSDLLKTTIIIKKTKMSKIEKKLKEVFARG